MTEIGCSPEIRSRFVKDVNGLTMHLLEAGFEAQDRPCVLLLHGFPELAYSWRNVMLPLAAAGYHVIAPDQRGYGQTTGWDGDYDGDVGSFRLLNLVRDALALVSALGYRSVAAVVGHDFGSPVAAWCALIRPDVFQSIVLMSAPFGGPPTLPFDTAKLAPEAAAGSAPGSRIHRDLAARTGFGENLEAQEPQYTVHGDGDSSAGSTSGRDWQNDDLMLQQYQLPVTGKVVSILPWIRTGTGLLRACAYADDAGEPGDLLGFAEFNVVSAPDDFLEVELDPSDYFDVAEDQLVWLGVQADDSKGLSHGAGPRRACPAHRGRGVRERPAQSRTGHVRLLCQPARTRQDLDQPALIRRSQ